MNSFSFERYVSTPQLRSSCSGASSLSKRGRYIKHIYFSPLVPLVLFWFAIDSNFLHFIHIVYQLRCQIISKYNLFSVASSMHAMKLIIFVALATAVSSTYFNSELLRRELLHQARATSSSIANAASSTSTTVTATAYTNSTDACSSVLQGLATLITGLPTPTGPVNLFGHGI